MATWRFETTTRWLVASPMFHTGGTIAMLATVWGGGTHVLMPSFSADLALDLIESEAITHTLLVPTMLAATVMAQSERPRDVGSLRYLSHGASPIAAETLRRVHQAFPGAELLHVYGTTETTPIATLLPHEERIIGTSLDRSCGQPAIGVDLRIIDKDGAELPACRGGRGHHPQPERDDRLLEQSGRYQRGAVERLVSHWRSWLSDRQSNLFLVDRAKDMIVSGGENIYSTEVENALAAHPSVAEAAVFGVPDDRWGEKVFAVVVTTVGVTPDELISHCRNHIAGFKVPRQIELRTEPLPKSAAGKVLKRDLREPHWAGQFTQGRRELTMHSTMSDFPLTISHIFRHGQECYGDSLVVTNHEDRLSRISFTDLAGRATQFAAALRRLGVGPRRPGRYLRLEQPGTSGGLFRGAVHGRCHAHGEYPPLRRADPLHHRPCRGHRPARRRQPRVRAGTDRRVTCRSST